ncbi:MAG: PAS domain S-box protein [Halioglobus sp.]
MSKPCFAALMTVIASPASAGVLDVFRFEDGSTNWQYIANTTGTVLIVALSYTLVRLFFTHRAAKRYNSQLEEIRNQLEERVRERTATLDESNRLLQVNHSVLEGEVTQHEQTATLLRKSESYIKRILRSMPLMLVGLDEDGVITQWNSKAEEVSGLEAGAVVGRNLWQAYPAITVTPDLIAKALKTKKTLTLKQSQRGGFHFDVTIYPLSTKNDPGVVVLIDDVTQRVSAENMLIQRDKMSSMGELAGSLAHDINTPVHAMLMDIREVQSRLSKLENSGAEGVPPLLDDALERGEQVSAVISNLLEFSSGHATEMRPTDITEVIEHSLDLASAVMTDASGLQFRDIRIEKNFEDNLPLIPCHETELQQVFLSLFRYCFHALADVERSGHTPSISLQVNTFYDALWLKVQHNGRGISLQEQQVIFEPLFADPNYTATEDYDAGRRLSYPYFIITEQHRGQLAVTSDIDIGTTFHIELLLS